MNFRQISAFVAVYEEGSFSRAAERLNATQSGLSMQIQNLEAQAGLRLFDRTSRGVAPTHAGRHFYTRATAILRQVAEAGMELENLGGTISGEIRIGLMPTFTRGALPPALAGFLREYPNVRVSITEAYSAVLTDQVASGSLDFAVVPKAPGRDGLRSSYLGTDRELLVCRAGTGPAHLAPARLADMPPLHLVLPAPGNARRDMFEAYAEIHGVPIAAIVDMDAMIATLEFVANSDWMTILPTTICYNDLDGGVRTLHPLVEPPLTVDYVLIERATGALSPAAKVFLEHLRTRLETINAHWAAKLAGRGAYQKS